ncbi:hypothetical protein BDR03DRAFT_986384 [Suillus americanus]|nr:hypothetical protein BDR03DRAFT_986384 [Suillus americanus]
MSFDILKATGNWGLSGRLTYMPSQGRATYKINSILYAMNNQAITANASDYIRISTVRVKKLRVLALGESARGTENLRHAKCNKFKESGKSARGKLSCYGR